MNEDTLISVHCYAGDADRVSMLLPLYEHHCAPVVIISPNDSPVFAIGPHICRHAGKRAYIGQDSLDRQIEHLKILLGYPFNFFLLNDSDSFCVSARIPQEIYDLSDGAMWSNEVGEPRPHQSIYPKIAAQPPYFLSRQSIERILSVAPKIRAHEITPYIDWAMLAWACEAGLQRHSFSELEQITTFRLEEPDPWKGLQLRIGQGAVMMHPIKTEEQRDLCVAARKLYEQSR